MLSSWRDAVPTMDLIAEIRNNNVHIISNATHVFCNVFEENAGALELAWLPKLCPHTKHNNAPYHHFHEHVFFSLAWRIRLLTCSSKPWLKTSLSSTALIHVCNEVYSRLHWEGVWNNAAIQPIPNIVQSFGWIHFLNGIKAAWAGSHTACAHRMQPSKSYVWYYQVVRMLKVFGACLLGFQSTDIGCTFYHWNWIPCNVVLLKRCSPHHGPGSRDQE